MSTSSLNSCNWWIFNCSAVVLRAFSLFLFAVERLCRHRDKCDSTLFLKTLSFGSWLELIKDNVLRGGDCSYQKVSTLIVQTPARERSTSNAKNYAKKPQWLRDRYTKSPRMIDVHERFDLERRQTSSQCQKSAAGIEQSFITKQRWLTR